MFFDFLSNRMTNKKMEASTQTLLQLETASKKIEQLVENIYRQVDTVKADQAIALIDIKSDANSFFASIAKIVNETYFITNKTVDDILAIDTNCNWYDFINNFEGFDIIHGMQDNKMKRTDCLVHDPSRKIIASIDGELTKKDKVENQELEKGFNAYKSLPIDQKRELLENYSIPF